jgi:hypothetical protein
MLTDHRTSQRPPTLPMVSVSVAPLLGQQCAVTDGQRPIRSPALAPSFLEMLLGDG